MPCHSAAAVASFDAIVSGLRERGGGVHMSSGDAVAAEGSGAEGSGGAQDERAPFESASNEGVGTGWEGNLPRTRNREGE